MGAVLSTHRFGSSLRIAAAIVISGCWTFVSGSVALMALTAFGVGH